MHLSDEFVKDGVSPISPRRSTETQTNFAVGKASAVRTAMTDLSASDVISSARRSTPNQRAVSGIARLFRRKPSKKHAAYRQTAVIVPDGPACRIYGSVQVKKVTANLHITTLGHGYMSYEHTDHQCKPEWTITLKLTHQ